MCRAVLLSSKKRRESRNKWGRNANGRKEKKRAPSLSLSFSYSLTLLLSYIFSTLDRPIYLRSISHRALLFLLRLLSHPLFFFSNHKVSLTFPRWFFFGECLKNRALAHPSTVVASSRETNYFRCLRKFSATIFRVRATCVCMHIYLRARTFTHTHIHTHIHTYTPSSASIIRYTDVI